MKERETATGARIGNQPDIYKKTLYNGMFNLAVTQSITEDEEEKGRKPMWVLTIVNEEIPLSPDDDQLIKAMNGGIFGAYIEFTRPYRQNSETGQIERVVDEKAKVVARKIINKIISPLTKL